MTTISTGDNNYNNIINNDNDKLERKIIIATEGLIPYAVKKLRGLEGKEGITTTTTSAAIGRQNIETICNYMIAVKAEINPSLMYKRNKLQVLCLLSEFFLYLFFE
jgi:hypothetical protein